MDYAEIQKARKILKLPEKATAEELREAYRKLFLRYHPDRRKGSEKSPETARIREIIRARDVLLKYLASYRYMFSEEEFKKHLGPESKDAFDRFYADWF